MKKPTLFIGSTQEAKQIVKDIHARIQDTVSVRTWYQDTFNLGENFLDDLRREILLADYALLVITPDDEIVKRDKQGYAARDNVLLELGMFLGALGPRRSFYLVVNDHQNGHKKEPNIPTDLDGITRLQLTITEDNNAYSSDLGAQCIRLEKAINRSQNNLELNILPSTSLAIGYFHNFVLKVCETLIRTPDLQVGNTAFDCTSDGFDFHIVLPNTGYDSGHEGFTKFTRRQGLDQAELKSRYSPRTFPFFIDSQIVNDPKTGKERVKLYDWPTTLLSAREAILLAAPSATENEINMMEQREIHNFERTLRRLLRDPKAANFSDNILVISSNNLSN